MDGFLGFISALSNWLWGIPLLTLLVFGGVFFTLRLKFFHIRHAGYIFKQTLGKMFDKSTHGEGTVTPFQALTSALACSVGAGNIVGVPVAIMLGGPGAIFWMWFVALLGMSLKYAEVVLAIRYREKNIMGEYVGGPMYYMTKGLKWKPLGKCLGIIFAVGLMFEVVPSTMVQANSLAGSAKEVFHISPIITGIITTIIVALVVIGGIKRIASFTEKFVPFMALLYIGGALITVVANATELPNAIKLIFTYAFQPMSAVGGFAGAAIATSLRWGFARGLYSNEAGLGTAPIAHSAATVDHPVRQGLWGIMEVFLDTIVICSATAFAILTSGVWTMEGAAENPSALSAMAFSQGMGGIGGVIVTASLILFVISTLIVLIYYGEKQAEFLFGLNFAKIMKYVYVLSIPLGAVGGAKVIWQFLDITLAIILIPNVITMLLLNKEVADITKEFFSSKKYYLKDIGEEQNKINT